MDEQKQQKAEKVENNIKEKKLLFFQEPRIKRMRFIHRVLH